MKPISESPLNKITLVFTLSLLLAAGLWAWLTLPTAQAQGGDEDLWRTLDTPFERVGRVLEDKGGNIWVVSLGGYSTVGPVTDTVTITETAQMSAVVQFVEGEGVARFDNGNWVTYTVESTNGGLPSNNIASAFADSQGDLWFGTYTAESLQGLGVTRFDGRAWQTFVEPSIVVDIEEDDQGGLWFATGLGLSRFTPDGQWESFTDEEVLGGTGIFDVYRADDGAMWFAVSKSSGPDSCLTRYQDGKWYPCEIEGVPFDIVGQLAQDKTGHWWVRSATVISVSSNQSDLTSPVANVALALDSKETIAIFDGETWQVGGPEESRLSDQFVAKMYQDGNSNLWFATESGLIWQDLGRWKTKNTIGGIRDILQDKTDNLFWFATGGSLKYYTGYRLQTFSKENGDLRSNDVRDWLEASTEAIWVATDKGVSRYQNGEWQTFTTANGYGNGYDVGSDYIRDLFEASDGAIWARTDSGLVSRYQNGKWQSFGDTTVSHLLEASDGAIWVGIHRGGVSRYQSGEWQTFSVESDNLYANTVLDLLEASDGAIWVGTWGGGVSRYQNGEWQTFRMESDGPGSNIVLHLLEASDGAIWIGTWYGGVSRYQDGKWQTFNREQGHLDSNFVLGLLEASDGTIWVGTDEGKVSRYQDGKWQTFSNLGSDYVFRLLEANDKAIWAGTDMGGVSRYQNGAWQIFNVESGDLSSNNVRDLLEASDGTIWAGTSEGGVGRYQGGKWQTFNVESSNLGSNEVWDLLEARGGAIWAGTRGGVSHYQKDEWQTFSVESGDLGSNDVRHLLEASDGAIWVATSSSGVSRYHDGEWQTFNVESGDLSSNYVMQLLETSDGVIWVGTNKGRVSRYQNGEWQTFSVGSGGPDSDLVTHLLEARDGAIWIGTKDGGVSRYQNGEWRAFSTESGDLSDNHVKYLLEASDGTIWVGTDKGEVSRYQGGKWRRTLSANYVQQLLKASAGAIWIGTTDGGVRRYQGGEWQAFSVESGDLSDNYARYMLEASDGTIWVETPNGGVSRYQNDEWQTFNEESGDLVSNDIRTMREGTDKAIWVSFPSKGGLSRYQNGEWQYFTDEEFAAMDIELVSSSLPRDPLVDNKGFIWTITDKGLTLVRPGHRPPWVELTTFNNTSLTTTARVLAYDDRHRILIGFAGNDLATRPEDLQYLYKLENSPIHTDWQVATYNEPILFDELDPRYYTLLVKTIDEDGNESEPAMLDITVENITVGSLLRTRYTIPGLGTLTLPQLLGGGVGLVTLLGLGVFGVTLWRRQQAKGRPRPLPKEYFNPYVAGGPVTGRNFVGRQDILADLITALKSGNHLIVEGERRIGKSSLLYELAEALRQDGDYCFIPAYVQLQRVTEGTLFYAIMREIARESRKRYQQLPPLRCEAPYVNYDTFAAEDDLLTIIETLKGTTDLSLRVVILLDEGDRLRDFTEETHSLLRGWMGAAIQKDVLILVWCGVSFDRAWHQRTSPWYNQFRSPVEVLPLSPQEARTLITHPVEGAYEYEDEAIERIFALSQGRPFVIQLICHECVRRIWQEQSGATITLADVEAVWPLVQRRLEGDEQAEVPSEDSTLPSLTYPTAVPARQMAEEAAQYDTEPEE